MSEDWWTYIIVSVRKVYLIQFKSPWKNFFQATQISLRVPWGGFGRQIQFPTPLLWCDRVPFFWILRAIYQYDIRYQSEEQKFKISISLLFFRPWRPAGIIYTLLVYTVFYNMRNNIVHSFGHASPTWWSFQSNWISASPLLPKKWAYPPNMCVNK